MALHAAYTPSNDEPWGYRLSLRGTYTVKARKRLVTGQTVELGGATQHATAEHTRLEFSVLPGNENPGIRKKGETVQIEVFQGEALMASLVFRREADHSLVTETVGCDLTYLPYEKEDHL